MAKNLLESITGNALWDLIKEFAKLMLPFFAGLGARQWTTVHATGLTIAAAFIVAFTIAFWDEITRGKARRSETQEHRPTGLNIEFAKWYCTVLGTTRDVTSDLQGRVTDGSLKIQAHDSVLGDVCQLHPGGGHAKTLEVDFAYRSHATAHDGETLALPCSSDTDERLAKENELQRVQLLEWTQFVSDEARYLIEELEKIKDWNDKEKEEFKVDLLYPLKGDQFGERSTWKWQQEELLKWRTAYGRFCELCKQAKIGTAMPNFGSAVTISQLLRTLSDVERLQSA